MMDLNNTRLDYIHAILDLMPFVVSEQGLHPMNLDLTFNYRELLRKRKMELMELYNGLLRDYPSVGTLRAKAVERRDELAEKEWQDHLNDQR